MEHKLFGHPIEITAFTKGPSEGLAVALFEFRPHPDENKDIVGLMLSQEQCVRIRDTLHEFLCNRDSWLYLPRRVQKAMKIQEDDND